MAANLRLSSAERTPFHLFRLAHALGEVDDWLNNLLSSEKFEYNKRENVED